MKAKTFSSKKFNFDNASKDQIIFLAVSGLMIFLAKASYDLYLHNPAFHMFIQSKGIFL
ncbi:Hypothetical protein P9515_12601 [Prochlorococcus marinus str. MIT 9515]|uniref:Uncharacterized protein n=1 Tax=Prochlorococcus marinus (strain MIT 9515) TaxID=167542 RepID=A2BXF6_PROM5|nr:hypothetical protein [Prochlorococcus marinus]ABM72467.1 Hypothetical protein P9515_12601 [Prochlorococcus marinus str. MIT 9515]